MKKKSKKHSGFTLVEMIISFALFAILMTPIYSMIISTMNHNKNGEIKQTASLQGQEIFEEIKNEDIVPVEDNSGNITGIKIGDTVISTSSNEVTQDFENGYKAKVKIQKNNSITLDKIVTSIATNNFNVALDGASSPVSIKSNNNSEELSYDNSDDVLKFVIIAKTEANSKLIEIRDEDNNPILQDGLYNLSDDKKGNQIKLILNFDKYKVLSKTDPTKLRSIKVNVYNQEDLPLNICLQKSIDLDVNIDTILGNVRVYDNRSNNSFKLGELYDIDVEVTQTINGETKTVFTGKTSQNINTN